VRLVGYLKRNLVPFTFVRVSIYVTLVILSNADSFVYVLSCFTRV